jgi:hypothetical protein
MNALRFQQTRVVNLTNLVFVNAPQFAQDQSDLLHRDPTATLHTLDQKQWVTLAGWMDAEHAVVQCRRSGLTVKVNRKDKVTASLLPLGDGFPKAVLAYTIKGATSQQKERKLETNLNVDGGALVMAFRFTSGDIYDEVFSAMTAQPADIRIEISYAHSYQVQSSASATHVPAQPPVKTQAAAMSMSPHYPKVAYPAKPAPGKGSPAKPGLGKPAAKPAPAPAHPVATAQRVSRVDTRRVIIPPPPPPANTTTTFRSETLSGQKITIPAAHAQTETDVFPDLSKQATGGWGQFNVSQHRTLHYQDSPRSDTFFYLPTTFKLGCYSDPSAGPEASRLPLRVELYSDKDKVERIKATLVALPCVEDSERQALRQYLCHDVLQGQQPFVNLTLKSGLKSKFLGDFAAGSASGQQILPADIAFQESEVIPDQRLVLHFDMPASSYAIFCEIMKFGIFGQVQVSDSEKGMESVIDVRLQLQDLVTNQLVIQHTPPEVPKTDGAAAPQVSAPTASTPSAATPPATGTLKLQNLLDFPVQVSSLTVNYLDVGKSSRQIFSAESVNLPLPSGQLPAKSDPASTATFTTKPQQLTVWDETVVETGQIKVQGGTPEDWLARVNRDPSLQAHTYNVQLQLVVSPAIRDKVQLVRLKLFRAGDPKVRTSLDLLPTSPPPVLHVTMTMEELMGTGTKAPQFYVEYETVAVDGNTSLPQRTVVSPDLSSLVVQAVVETPKSIFTVEFPQPDGMARQELDRAATEELIAQLQLDGSFWSFSVKEPEADSSASTTAATTKTGTGTQDKTPGATDPKDTKGTDPSTTKPPASPEVTIVTDLAAIAFQDGTLSRVFVVLKPPTDGAGQQSSFVLDKANSSPVTWRPQGFTVPPFRYEITYLYSSNQVRQTSGTGSDLTLILDPPKIT